MSDAPRITLNFFKLIVTDLPKMQAFYETAFGFKEVNRIKMEHLEEVMMTLPSGPMTLVLYKHLDGRDVTVGNGHGPVGLVTKAVDEYYDKALAAGGTEMDAPRDLGQMRVAFVRDPEGHEIELIKV